MELLTSQLIEPQQVKYSKIQIFQHPPLHQSPEKDKLTFQLVRFQKFCFQFIKRLPLFLKLEINILYQSRTKLFIQSVLMELNIFLLNLQMLLITILDLQLVQELQEILTHSRLETLLTFH